MAQIFALLASFLLVLVTSPTCSEISPSTPPPSIVLHDVTVVDGGSSSNVTVAAGAAACRLSTVDPNVYKHVAQLLKDKATLINYVLTLANHTSNPLATTMAGALDASRWSRVTTAHGQTLLSLAFNYGILSMMTLTLGTETLDIELQDSPPGCFDELDDRRKVDAVRQLLMRDFDAAGPIQTVDDARICNEIVVNEAGYGKFRHNCCFKDSITGREDECSQDIGNFWLDLLFALLMIIRFALLLFGPAMFISAVESMSKQNVPYVVTMKEPLRKTVVFTRKNPKEAQKTWKNSKVLDLRFTKAFPKLRQLTRRQPDSSKSGVDSCKGPLTVPENTPVRVNFSQYDINVDYRRTLKENTVPVGLLRTLFDTIFKCQIRHVGPFVDCCRTNMLRPVSSRRNVPWIKCFRKLSRALLILLVPFPFYLRLIIFYVFEVEELNKRKQAVAANGLHEAFENGFIHYFTPTHGIFIAIYVLYGITAVVLAYMSRKGKEHRMKKIIVESFRDLKRLNWTDSLSMVVANVIWPFKRYGILGFFVGLVYWPIMLPLTVGVGLSYYIPTVYLTIRMAVHSKLAIFVQGRRSKHKKYKVRIELDQDMHKFETEKMASCAQAQKPINKDASFSRDGEADLKSELDVDDVDYIKPDNHIKKETADNVSLASSIIEYGSFSVRRFVKYTLCALLSILTLYAVVFVLSEVIGCFVEIVVFTIMGVIVNANALLKYIMLVLMIFVYCCDCFNNMAKKYLKMNKAIFNEVKCRIKNLDSVTSLPSVLQENHGFKSQELNEQAEYESPDDIAWKPSRHWMINDLVLFVDSEDTPRIPRQLFNEVCQIRVAGVPGPVFRGHLEAIQQLFKIVLFVLFVFIIVLSFGAVYKVSSTNQSLAALLGGFLPLVLRTFLAPPAPDVELGTVSFKSKMDEVIKNFCQYWPIHDLPFEIAPPEGSKEATDKRSASPTKLRAQSTSHAEPAAGNNNTGWSSQFNQAMLGQAILDEYGGANTSGIPLMSNPHDYCSQPVPLYKAEDDDDDDDDTDVDELPTKREGKDVVDAPAPKKDDEVDIVIYLPEENWLDEWSDNGSLEYLKTADSNV